MKYSPLVSIVIPCYNHSSYIEKSVKSALNQTYGNIEIILIDNGSTDNSREIILKFAQQSKIRIVLYNENHPPGKKGSVVGKAINEAKGELVSILYSDDWYLPDKIEKQVDLLGKSNSSVGVVYCHGYRYFQLTDTMEKWKYQSVRGYVFKDYLSNGDVAIPISPLVKKYCYDIVGVNNLWTGSEYDFLVMSQYVDFDFVDEHLVVMRDHDTNDAKNVLSVYKRLKKFHTIALLEGGARSREGGLVNMRVAHDALADGLEFVTMLDKSNGREAIFYAIKIYPLIVLRWKLVVAIVLIYLPLPLLSRLLDKLGKNSLSRHVQCDW